MQIQKSCKLLRNNHPSTLSSDKPNDRMGRLISVEKFLSVDVIVGISANYRGNHCLAISLAPAHSFRLVNAKRNYCGEKLNSRRVQGTTSQRSGGLKI